MAQAIALGALALVTLYWLPGWIFLRRSGLDLPTRAIAAAGVGFGAMTTVATLLGAAGVLGQETLAVAVLLVLALAAVCPLPADCFYPRTDSGLTLPLWIAGLVGVAMVLQSVRPAILRLPDAVSFWGPLAVDISASGSLVGTWIPTLVDGFPRSVGLTAGSVSLLTGGFQEAYAFVIHPIFSTLMMLTVVLLAGSLGGRRASWIALAVMMATPLLSRGVFFHDDIVVSFFVTLALLIAIRAERWPAWAVAGVVAGSGLAVKPLGGFGAVMVLAILIVRRPSVGRCVAAAAGWVIGLPWYVWNIVRFGNPLFPFFPGVFDESPEVARVLADHDAALGTFGKGSIWEIGGLALVLLVVGLVTALIRAVGAGDSQTRGVVFAVVAVGVVFTLLWQSSDYASRHALTMLPSLAAVSGASLQWVDRIDRRLFLPTSAVNSVGVAALAALLLVSAWSAATASYAGKGEPDSVAQTGLYAILIGKWHDLETALDPPSDLLTLHGRRVSEAWHLLQNADPDLLVYSFDSRTYFFPQTLLVANDVRALPVYRTLDAAEQHAVLVAAGVGYVLDRPSLGRRHPLYAEGPWADLVEYSEFYRPLLVSNNVRLFEVLGR